MLETDYLLAVGRRREMAVRADHPFQPRGGDQHYFEIEVVQVDEEDPDSLAIGIGLCGELVDISRGFPGWPLRRPSIGYHGDDGIIFMASGDDDYLDSRRPTSKTFGLQDKVGCGIDWGNRTCYFTLNGGLVGELDLGIAQNHFPLHALDF